jgi:short subunit dehydrogenase
MYVPMNSERPLTPQTSSGRTALITGGGRGLGRAFALGLASAGMAVAVVARTEEELAETVRQVNLRGTFCAARRCCLACWLGGTAASSTLPARLAKLPSRTCRLTTPARRRSTLENREDVTVEPATTLVVFLSTGAGDHLSGKLLSAKERPVDLARRIERIQGSTETAEKIAGRSLLNWLAASLNRRSPGLPCC